MEQTGILTKILSKNIDLSYLEKGVGPTIIFLHGISGNKEIWVPQLKIFSKQFRTISWDARGYGKSKPIKNSFNFGQFTSDLYDLIQHLELNNIIFAGIQWEAELHLISQKHTQAWWVSNSGKHFLWI